MKPIKFDLPIDGVKVATVDELRDHFTTEILKLFREGVLVKWLRTRPENSTELAAVEALPNGQDEPTLLALCKVFRIDAGQHTVKAALTGATGVPPSSSASLASKPLRHGAASGSLAPGREDRWLLELTAPAYVQVEVSASADIACMLENARGRQLATDGTLERKQAISLAAILFRGRYYLRLRAVDEEATAKYNLQFRQDDEVPTSDIARHGDNVYPSDEAVLAIKDLTTDSHREQTSNRLYETIWQQNATLPPACVHLWIVEIPEKVAHIRTTGTTDTVGRLLGPDGNVLRKDDNSGAGRNFLISTSRPLSGHFGVAVCGASPNTSGDYRIRVGLKAGHRPGLKSHGIRIAWDEFSQPKNWRS